MVAGFILEFLLLLVSMGLMLASCVEKSWNWPSSPSRSRRRPQLSPWRQCLCRLSLLPHRSSGPLLRHRSSLRRSLS